MLQTTLFISCCLFAVTLPFDITFTSKGLYLPLIKHLLILEIIVLSFFWELFIIHDRKLPRGGAYLAAPFLAFFFVHLFSSIFPSEKVVWSLKYTFRFFGLGIIAFAIINFVKTVRQLEWLVRSLLIGAAAASIFVVIQYCRPYLLTDLQYFFNGASVSPHRIRGLFGWPTNMSVYFGTLLPLVISLLINKPKAGVFEKAFYLSLLVAFFSCLLLSKTRGWIVGLFCGLTTLWVIHLLRRREYRLLWMGTVVLFFVLLLFSVNIFGVRESIMNDLEMTEVSRLQFAKAALRMISEHWPKGIGADMFYWRHQPYYRTHNIFLETLVNLGIVGFVVFLWLLGVIIWAMGSSALRKPNSRFSYLAVGALASLMSFIGHCQVDYFWNLHVIIGLFWVIVGIGVCSPVDSD